MSPLPLLVQVNGNVLEVMSDGYSLLSQFWPILRSSIDFAQPQERISGLIIFHISYNVYLAKIWAIRREYLTKIWLRFDQSKGCIRPRFDQSEGSIWLRFVTQPYPLINDFSTVTALGQWPPMQTSSILNQPGKNHVYCHRSSCSYILTVPPCNAESTVTMFWQVII